MNLACIYNCPLTPNHNFDHHLKRNRHIGFIEITHEIMRFKKWTVALLQCSCFYKCENELE